ncbi:MAG: hypothetical protein NTU79_00930 [Planctomycetota bacterium]|nr:hypothetical protein [Planctomycetota bacterium]
MIECTCHEEDTSSNPIELRHNLEPDRFMWLWMKYVAGVNDQYHCTNCLRGKYGKLLSKHNPALTSTPTLNLDEQFSGSYAFIYICGVLKKGYPRTNYSHNLHAVIKPCAGSIDAFQFENWELGVSNGVFERIPCELDLPARYRSLAPEFTTCRIFRWAVCSTLNAGKKTNVE